VGPTAGLNMVTKRMIQTDRQNWYTTSIQTIIDGVCNVLSTAAPI